MHLKERVQAPEILDPDGDPWSGAREPWSLPGETRSNPREPLFIKRFAVAPWNDFKQQQKTIEVTSVPLKLQYKANLQINSCILTLFLQNVVFYKKTFFFYNLFTNIFFSLFIYLSYCHTVINKSNMSFGQRYSSIQKKKSKIGCDIIVN